VFGLECLIAIQEPIPSETVSTFLRKFGDGDGLDFVHLCCLIRCWANISKDMTSVPVSALLSRLASHRNLDGGFGNVYRSFLALGAYQDLRVSLPEPGVLLASVRESHAGDGGYANRAGDAHGITTVTAAAAMLFRTLAGSCPPHLNVWLLDRCHSNGGFLATPSTPVPDLLSTATALHALAALHVPLNGIHEACLDFVDSLWTNRGGFYGSWLDDALDCEYTYYGLLALGHLTVAGPA
jgi:prenyltransferase beta subunit